MRPLGKIVIVGGGTSGWLAASMLCQHLKRELCEIELVESEELGTIGVGESTVPPFVGLIQRLGIDEQEFIRATDGTYKLGIKFVGWHQRSDSYFHPFGVIGKPIGNHDFYQCWLKARAEGNTSALQDFSPCNVMAEQGRFFHPGEGAQHADRWRQLRAARGRAAGHQVPAQVRRGARAQAHGRQGRRSRATRLTVSSRA